MLGAKSLMRNFTVPNSNSKAPGDSHYTTFFLFFSFLQTFQSVFGLKETQQTSNYLPPLFIISALLHIIPLLLDILPTVISVLVRTLFSWFLPHSPLSTVCLPISCQGTPQRITKSIKNNQKLFPIKKKKFLIVSHLLSFLSCNQ